MSNDIKNNKNIDIDLNFFKEGGITGGIIGIIVGLLGKSEMVISFGGLLLIIALTIKLFQINKEFGAKNE